MLHFLVKKMFTAQALTASAEDFAAARTKVCYETDNGVAVVKKLDINLVIKRGENRSGYGTLHYTALTHF
jgi:hypothetical protein